MFSQIDPHGKRKRRPRTPQKSTTNARNSVAMLNQGMVHAHIVAPSCLFLLFFVRRKGPQRGQQSLWALLDDFYFVIFRSAPLPTIQFEALLVQEQAQVPHLNPSLRRSFLPLTMVLEGKAKKVLRKLAHEPAMLPIG